MTLIYAHRGASGTHPENTMEAFIAAERDGADGIELDVQLSKEGEIVVIHDATVNRTTNGKGFVKELTVQELQQLNAGVRHRTIQSFLEKSRIPTLIEVFEWMKGNKLFCNIELKTGKMRYPLLEEKLVKLIQAYRYEDRVVLSSFNHYSIIQCYQLCPDLETAPLYSNGIFMPWIYANAIHAKGIHPKLRVASNEIIESALEAGIAVRPYTINKTKDIERLMRISCTAIITDYPKKASQIKAQIKA